MLPYKLPVIGIIYHVEKESIDFDSNKSQTDSTIYQKNIFWFGNSAVEQHEQKISMDVKWMSKRVFGAILELIFEQRKSPEP